MSNSSTFMHPRQARTFAMLSEYSRNLLNLIRKEMLGVPELARNHLNLAEQNSILA